MMKKFLLLALLFLPTHAHASLFSYGSMNADLINVSQLGVYYQGTNGLVTSGGSLVTLLSNNSLASLANSTSISTGVATSSGLGSECASGICTQTQTASVINSMLVLTVGAIGTAVNAGANVSCWFLTSVDGTNFENSSNIPARSPDVIFPLQPRTYSAGEVIYPNGRSIVIPPTPFKLMCQNNTGQALASTGNSIVLAPSAWYQ